MSRKKQQSLFEPEPLPWELAEGTDLECAQVVFDRPLEQAYSYLVPDALRGQVRPGQRVRVPFGRGNRWEVGFCVALTTPESARRLKVLDSVIDREPLISPRMLELTEWIASEYLCGWGQVLNSVIPAGVKKRAGTRLVTLYAVDPAANDRLGDAKLTEKQRAVIEVLRGAEGPLPAETVGRLAGCGIAPIQSLSRRGFLTSERCRAAKPDEPDQTASRLEPEFALNHEQDAALNEILKLLRKGEHRTVLLHGVTGSGKTEVYIRGIREVVSYGRQAIVLVPEISLTPQTIRRFRCRFDSVAVLHSHLSDVERHQQWRRIASGDVQVVVGARSAIFAPTRQLGLIIIDEEHETTFKQESTPRYHARDVARRRAALEGVPLILGSATPSLESWRRARNGSDVLLQLKERVGDLPMPPVIIVDVRSDPQCGAGASIGRALQAAIRSALNDGGQVILFLNLRGHSPVLWCRGCGKGVTCPDCAITLTWHKDRKKAVCHHCDYMRDVPTCCPECGHAPLRHLGAGTQRLEEEVRARFPSHRCLRMDSDAMRKPGSHDVALEAFRQGKVKILLGTQMIGKGLHFPNVTLVGIIDADTVLHQPDIRASERTFQLIAQVAGRAGRGSKGGRVIVQTCSPAEPPIMAAARHDFEAFAEQELKHRQEMSAPPFEHLVRVILRGKEETEVATAAKRLVEVLRRNAEMPPVRILGPAPAPVTKLNKNYRYHVQISAERLEDIQTLWRNCDFPRSKGVDWVVDVDALNMR